MLLRIWLLFAIFVTVTSDTAQFVKELVEEQDMKQALQYVSIYEMVNHVIEEVCLEFPELRPPTEKDEIQLRRELVWFLHLTDGKEIQDAMAGKPSRFKQIPIVIKQLRELARKDLPNLEKRGKVGFKDEDDWIYYVVYFRPMNNLLNQKIDAYKALGFTPELIDEDIKMKSGMAVHLFFHDDAEIKAAYRELKGKKKGEEVRYDKFESPARHAFDMYSMETKEYDWDRVFEFISIYELANYVVHDIFRKFPEMEPEDAGEKRELKRELVDFVIASDEEREKAVFEELTGFTMIPKYVEKLSDIAVRELPKLQGSQANIMRDEEDFVRFHGYIKPIMDHLTVKIESYEKRGMTKAEIREEKEYSENTIVRNLYGNAANAPLYVRRGKERAGKEEKHSEYYPTVEL